MDATLLVLARKIAIFNTEANLIKNDDILFGEDMTKKIKDTMLEREKMLYLIKLKIKNMEIDDLLSNPEMKIKGDINVTEIYKVLESRKKEIYI